MYRKLFVLAGAALLSFTAAACGSDNDTSSAGRTTKVGGSEGPVFTAAQAMKVKLQAMPDGGQPTIANFTSASAGMSGTTLTSIDDKDGDGKDDDAKATVDASSSGDKACLQHQNGKWEVTDDEC